MINQKIKQKLSNIQTCPYCNSQHIITEYEPLVGRYTIQCGECKKSYIFVEEEKFNGIHEN